MDDARLLQIARHILAQEEAQAEDPVRRRDDEADLLKVARHVIERRRKMAEQEEDPVMREDHRRWIAGMEAKSDDELCHFAARLILYAALDSAAEMTRLEMEMETATRH